MNMGFEMRCELRQSMDLVGGATTTIFPVVERMLCGETDCQLALEFVAGRKEMDRYHSMIDFLFCEIWTAFRSRCFTYYQKGGDERLLKNFLTEDERANFERWMISALSLAKDRLNAKRHASWKSFQIEVLRLAA